MIKIALAVAAALTVVPVFGGIVPPARAADGPTSALRVAQVGVELGRDRDRHDRDRYDHRHRDVTVGVGPGGVYLGPRHRCRTVTTWITRDNGRRIRRTERRCD